MRAQRKDSAMSASRPWSEPGQTTFEVDQSLESEAGFDKAQEICGP